MRPALLIFLLVFPATCATGAGDSFLAGADVSFLPQVEAGGGVFMNEGVPGGFFTILRSQGIDTIRLRLWHAPADGHSGLEETLDLAARAHAAGLGILLDFHYSDTWADPGHQTKPAAWAGLSAAALSDSIRAYTRDVMAAFAVRDLTPEYVQIGNEITPGMLWDTGRVGGSFDTPAQWANLAALLQAAIAGIDDAVPGPKRPEIMLHIDRGGDNGGARWFFDNLVDQGVQFDLIGLSYYPWWHGSLADLDFNLDDLAVRYEKDLVVVETAYPWTLGWFDDTHNIVGLPEHLQPGYPATPEGQRAFLAAVLEIVRTVPGDRGRGVFWWAPEWIASAGFGSAWENLTLFDETGNALPALGEFRDTTDVNSTPVRTGLRLAPNPFSGETKVSFEGPFHLGLKLEIFDIRGRRMAQNEGPSNQWTWRPGQAPAGTYLFRVTSHEGQWSARATLVR